MQIQTSVRCHLTRVRTAIIKKSTNNKCWRGCGEKGTLLCCWWECKLVQPLWRTVRRLLIKQSHHMIHQSHSLAYMQKIVIQKDTCTPTFIAALFTIAKTWKHPKCPLMKMWVKIYYIYGIIHIWTLKGQTLEILFKVQTHMNTCSHSHPSHVPILK